MRFRLSLRQWRREGYQRPGAGQCISDPARGGGGGGGGCCPFSAGSASGGGGRGVLSVSAGSTSGGGGGAVPRGGCKLQPPTNPPLHFLESIAFLATNLLCDNDCGYDNYVST